MPSPSDRAGQQGAKPEATRTIWAYGVNDHAEEPPAEALKAFKASGSFRQDFSALCGLWGVAPHPALGPAREGGGEPDAPHLTVQASLLDMSSVRVARHVLPAATHLEVVRLSGCRLDVEMLGLLHAGIMDGGTVTTLQVDWNPLDVPPEAEALRTAVAEGNTEEIDAVERRRELRQADRVLAALREELEAAGAGLEAVLREVATAADPAFPATAMLTPLSLRSWASAFHARLGLPSQDLEEAFRILDGPSYGPCDGLVPVARLQEALQALPAASAEEEARDPVAAAFASFVDGSSTLEQVSFRCCRLARLEAQAIARGLAGAQHLKALNLWGNRLGDEAAAALAEALEAYFGLQYLGLGRNRVTHAGLESLCQVLGTSRIETKEQADPILKSIKEQLKERDKKMKNPPVPKRDARGRERYAPEPFHVDSCEERQDAATGQVYWLRTRNTALRTLILEHNPVADAATVLRLLPFGTGGDLVLRGVPCVQELMEAKAQEEAEQAAAETTSVASGGERPASQATAQATGWNLVLK